VEAWSAAGLARQYALAIGQLPNTVLVALDEGWPSSGGAQGTTQAAWCGFCVSGFDSVVCR